MVIIILVLHYCSQLILEIIVAAEVEAFEAVVFCLNASTETEFPRDSKGEKIFLLPDIIIPHTSPESVAACTLGLLNVTSESIRAVVSLEVASLFVKFFMLYQLYRSRQISIISYDAP